MHWWEQRDLFVVVNSGKLSLSQNTWGGSVSDFLVVIGVHKRMTLTFVSPFEFAEWSDVGHNQTFWCYVLISEYYGPLLLFCPLCFSFGEIVHPHLVELSFSWSCLAGDGWARNPGWPLHVSFLPGCWDCFREGHIARSGAVRVFPKTSAWAIEREGPSSLGDF